MRTHRCRGVTLIELIVLIVVIAILLAIFVNVLQSQRGGGISRRAMPEQPAQYRTGPGQRHVGKEPPAKRGTFYDDPADHQGEPLKSNIYRALTDPGSRTDEADFWLRNWVVEILPYIDEQDLYNLLSAHLGRNFSEYRSTAGSALEGVRHPQQAQDLPLQPRQLRGELHRRSLARDQRVTLHVLEQVDHPAGRRPTAGATFRVERQTLDLLLAPSHAATPAPAATPPAARRSTHTATPGCDSSPSSTPARPRSPSSSARTAARSPAVACRPATVATPTATARS